MKSDQPTFEAELTAIRQELIRLGVQPRESQAKPATHTISDKTVIPSELMTSAYEMAGYAVATLALGRKGPEIIALKGDNQYDLGKCTERELDIIWTVGQIAGERGRSQNCSGEQGRIVINFELESSVASEMRPNPGAEAILNQNWVAIAGVARLLIERGALSRNEVEAAVLQWDADEPP